MAGKLISLSDPECLDPALVGGKAANLARLYSFGVRVPVGFVLTTWAFDTGDVPDEAVTRAKRLSEQAGKLIVRSSAVGEDGASAAFAGQLVSIPDVTVDGLRDAVHRCWASYHSERVQAYQAQRGHRLHGMGVIVQAQVEARFSGVCFTEAPKVVSDRGTYLEYVAGPGELLVSGMVTPGNILDAGPLWAHEPFDSPMPNDMARHVIATCRWIADQYGTPQDVEWVIDPAGTLYIVQSRPITAE